MRTIRNWYFIEGSNMRANPCQQFMSADFLVRAQASAYFSLTYVFAHCFADLVNGQPGAALGSDVGDEVTTRHISPQASAYFSLPHVSLFALLLCLTANPAPH